MAATLALPSANDELILQAFSQLQCSEDAAQDDAFIRPIFELFTWRSISTLSEASVVDAGTFSLFGGGPRRSFPSAPSSASGNISEEESISEGEERRSNSSFGAPSKAPSSPLEPVDAEADADGEAGAVFRPGGKYSCDASMRCQHKEHWDRLRGKRGYSYFECRKCGLCWRQPTKSKMHAKA